MSLNHLKFLDENQDRCTLAKHKAARKVDKDAWRFALNEVGSLARWDVPDRNESTVIEEICATVINGLSRNLRTAVRDWFAGYLGETEFQVKEIMTLFCRRRDDVRFLGICGLPGIGKTQLARLIFDAAASQSQFQHRSFICIGEDYNELVRLQLQLICETIQKAYIKARDYLEGREMIRKNLSNKRMLVVIDDVTSKKQLEALVGKHDWFGNGSRILITTKDRSLLRGYADEIYEPEELSEGDAFQLFSWEAFRENRPSESYMKLCGDIIPNAGGIPLALEVYGSFFYSRSLDNWDAFLRLIKVRPMRDITKTFNKSLGELRYSQKMLFLDIVCFFNGECISDVSHKLECLGYHHPQDINVLRDKYLIKILADGRIHINNLLVNLGEYMANCESSEGPHLRTRLWQCEDIIDALQNNIGLNMIESIVLNLPLPNPEVLNFEAFSKMKNLKMLVIRPKKFSQFGARNEEVVKALQSVKWVGDASKFKLSERLSILEWWGYPFNSLPTGFSVTNFEPPRRPTHDIRLCFQLNSTL